MKSSIEKLEEIMETLRSEKGCPWDRAQDLETLQTFVIEEAYEVVEADREGAPEKLKEELGDLLLQIVFQAQIARENGWFSLKDVVESICGKMIERHPHVFGDETAQTPEEVLEKWERRKNRSSSKGLWSNIPVSLPALLKAYRLGDRASQLGFDWENLEGVKEKIDEEYTELQEACSGGDPASVSAELGDLFFVMAQMARHLGVDPESALQGCNTRFIKRMQWMHDRTRSQGKQLDDLDLESLESLWQLSKRECS